MSTVTDNIHLVGKDDEIKAKAKAASKDKEWEGVGLKLGVTIWRVEKFQLHKVPKESYGTFYDGDSYVLLNTIGDDKTRHHHIHFWLGKDTTMDEAGTAAYKTVELDAVLGGAPTNYREVQGNESHEFSLIFPKGFKILSGGVGSGFNHVKPEDYKPKLLHIKGKNRITVCEVPVTSDSLNDEDAFVLDGGLKVYAWFGVKAGINDKFKGNMICEEIRDSRKGVEIIHLTHDGSDDFWKALGGKKPIKTKEEVNVDKVEKNQLFEFVEDKKDKISFKKLAEGNLTHDMLKSDHTFIVDFGDQICVWIGKSAAKKEKENAILEVNDYIGLYNRPAYISVCCINEGHEGPEFKKRISGK